jgi:hypothetical protein
MDPDRINKALMLLGGLALNETIAQRLVLLISPLEFYDLDNLKELDNIITVENVNAFYHILTDNRLTDFGKRFYRSLLRIVLKRWATNQDLAEQREIANRYRELLLDPTNDPYVTMAGFKRDAGFPFTRDPPALNVTKPLLDSLRMVLSPRTDQLLGLLGIDTVPNFITTVGEMLKRTAWAGFETGFYFTFLPLIYAYWIENQTLLSEEALVGTVWAMLFMSGVMTASLIEKRRDEPAFKQFSQVVMFTLMALLAISYFGPFVEGEVVRASAPVMKKWIPPVGYLITKVLQAFPREYKIDPKFSVEMISLGLFINSYRPKVQELILALVTLFQTALHGEMMRTVAAGAAGGVGIIAYKSGLFSYILDLIVSRQNPTRNNRRQRNQRQQQAEYVDGDMGFLRQLFQLPEFPDDVTKSARNSLRKFLSFVIVLYACQKLTNGGLYSPGSGCEPMIVTKLVEIMEMDPRDIPSDQYAHLENAFSSVQRYYEPTTVLPQTILKNMVANPYCERVLRRLYQTWPNHWESVIAMGGRGVANNDPRPAILDLYAKITTYRKKLQEENVRLRGDPQGDAMRQLQEMINEINAALRQSGDIWTSVVRRAITIYSILIFLAYPFNEYVGISFLSLMEIDSRRRPVVRQVVRDYDAQPRGGGRNFEDYLLGDVPSPNNDGRTMLEDVLVAPVNFNVSAYPRGYVVRRPSDLDIISLRQLQNISSWEPTVAQQLAPLHSLMVTAYPDFWYQNGIMARVGGREINADFTSLKEPVSVTSVLEGTIGYIKKLTPLIKFETELAIANNPTRAAAAVLGAEYYGFENWEGFNQVFAIGNVLNHMIGVFVGLAGLKVTLQTLVERGVSGTWSFVWGNVIKYTENLQEAILPLLSKSLPEQQQQQWSINDREKERDQQKKWRMAFAFAESLIVQEVFFPLVIPFHTFNSKTGVWYTMIYVAIMHVFWRNIIRTTLAFDESVAPGQTNRSINPIPLGQRSATTTATTATTATMAASDAPPPGLTDEDRLTPAQVAAQMKGMGGETQGLQKL